MRWSRGQKVKGEGHMVTKAVTVAQLLVTRAALPCAATAGVGLHVDTTAWFSSFKWFAFLHCIVIFVSYVCSLSVHCLTSCI